MINVSSNILICFLKGHKKWGKNTKTEKNIFAFLYLVVC